MGGSDQYQAQAADAELKDVDVAEQQPETPTPMDETTGETTKRRAPDLTGFRVQDPIAEPEFMGMTATEDLSRLDSGVSPVTRRTTPRHQSALRGVTAPKDSHCLPGGYALGSVVCSETETADGTVRRGELGIVVQEPISAAEPGCGQKRKISSNGSGVWVCFGRTKAQKRCNDLLAREKQRVYMRELAWKRERDQTRRGVTVEGVDPSLGGGEWWKEPIPDCLVSTFKEDWAPVLRAIIEVDKVEPQLVRIDDIFSYDTASEFSRDSEGTLRPVVLRDIVRNQQQHGKVEGAGCGSAEVTSKRLRGLSGRGWSAQGSTWATKCTPPPVTTNTKVTSTVLLYHSRWCSNRWSVPKGTGVGFVMSKAPRLCQWKTASLLYQGDWAAAKAVTGDWIPCHDRRTGWGTPGAQIVTEWWKAIEAGEVSAFLESVRQDGHAEVALGGETLFLNGNRSLDTRIDPLDNKMWLSQLESAYNMSRLKPQRPTVISWNVGPLGYMLSLHKMSQTLKIGAPVVLFQEIRIPTNAQRRIKMELGTLHPEYAFYIEAGRESRAQRSPQSSRWGSDLNTAVLTCLHREVFNTSKTFSRKWLSAQSQKTLAHLANGRVLWLETETVEGQAIRVINIHQATSNDRKRQDIILEGVAEALLSRESMPTMLGGDLNAAPPGGRFGYATGNAKHIIKVDEAVQNFLARTGGKRIMLCTPTWRSADCSHAAALDGVLYWGMQSESTSAHAEWVGDLQHDHARCCFRIGHEFLGECRQRRSMGADTGESLQLKLLREVQSDLDEWSTREGERVWKLMNEGSISRRVGAKMFLTGKLRKANELIMAYRDDKQKRCTGRLPHRNHLQITLLRETALLTKAGMEVMTLQHISHAVSQSLTLMEFSEEEMDGLQEYSPKSRHLIHQAVGCRLHWRSLQLTELTDRQERQSRWILDQQAGRKFLEDHKGPGKFTGRVGKQTDQKDLMWETPVGAIYVSRSEIDTQQFRGGADKIGVVTWQQATVLRVRVQTDAIETTAKVIQQATRAWIGRRRPDDDGRQIEENGNAPQEHESGEDQGEAPWGNIGSMGIRVDSEWWWVSEDTGAEECLREWMTVIRDTAESMKTGFLFHQPMWGWDQLEQGLEEGGVGPHAAPRNNVTVTLVYTEDLTSVGRILSAPVTAVNGSVTRKVVVHGGPWQQDALPLVWELFFEQGGFSPHARCNNTG